MDTILTQIKLKIAKKRYDESIGLLKSYIVDHPDSSDAYIALAQCWFNKSDYDKALHFAGQARELEKNCIESYQITAYSLGMLGRYDEAISCFTNAVKVDRENIRTYLILADIFYRKGDVAASLDYLLLANSIIPDRFEIHNELGRFYLREKKFRSAIQELKKSYILHPSYDSFVAILGVQLVRFRWITTIIILILFYLSLITSSFLFFLPILIIGILSMIEAIRSKKIVVLLMLLLGFLTFFVLFGLSQTSK